MDPAAAHRRDPVAGPGGCAVAGRAGLLRLLAGGVWLVSTLAAGRDLGSDRDRATGPRRRCRADHLGRVGGLDHRPSPSARGRCPYQPRRADRTTRWCRYRTDRPCVGPLTWRPDHEAAPGMRTGPETVVDAVDRWAARG